MLRRLVISCFACTALLGCGEILGIQERLPLPDDVGGGGDAIGGNAAGGAQGGGGAMTCEAPYVDDVDNCGAPGAACLLRANSVPACEACMCRSACNPGYGDCDGDAANGCETDLSISDEHCGGCGYGCADPGCALGACLMTTATSISDLEIHGGELFILRLGGSKVARCATTGCDMAPEPVATSSGSPGDLHVDGSGVVFSALNPYAIWHCADPAGCTAIQLIDEGPMALFADDTRIVWAGAGGLRSVPRGGGVIEVLDPAILFTAAVVESGELFYAAANPGEVGRCDIADCAATRTSLATGNVIARVAVDSTQVYYFTTGALWSVAQDGGAPINLAPVSSPNALRLTESHVYWVDLDGLHRVPKAGGQKDLIDATGRRAFVLDDQMVFLANGPEVWRFPIPPP